MAKKFFYQETPLEIATTFRCDMSQGLSSQEAMLRLRRDGYNVLEQKKKKTLWQMFVEQFKSFMILILLVAAVISGLLGEMGDTVIIMAIVVLNAILGVVQESRAEKSLEALQKMSAPHAKVLRNGEVTVVPAQEVVTGDVVVLETGDLVPADLRLIESVNLKIQEAALTGESVPVEKKTGPLSREAALGDQVNMAFSGSLVAYGRGRGIVVATGMRTQVGKIARLIQHSDDTETPLKIKLETLGKTMGIAVLAICALIFLVGMIYGREPFQMFFTAVSLAVAAIPEGLPAIATIVLAIGVQRMVEKHAIIRTLPAVETLGSASVICSDKTGTLTQNRMTVSQIALSGQVAALQEKLAHWGLAEALLAEGATLCNDSQIKEDGEVVGDPTETALVTMALAAGQDKKELEAQMPRVAEVPFDSERKLMTTVHKQKRGYRIYTKGAVDELVKVCSGILFDGKVQPFRKADYAWIEQANERMAASALRVLAVAYRDSEVLPKEPEKDLVFIGMVGMIDPPRPEAKEAVAICRSAGIKPVMITGDHKITALAIAQDLGILKREREAITGAELSQMSDNQLAANIEQYSVYARVAPEHKVRIVDAWQKKGHVVAMTGDGVNDAPALKRADIGAAMGVTGTEVAKEAADMVLTDDNFATVVAAVKEGRRIYDNILKTIQFLLSCNVGEILTLFVATMLNWASPLLPIHILWVNLVTDGLPALALGVDPAAPNIMERQAKDNSQGIFTQGMVWRIIYQGIMVGALTLAAFVIGQKVDLPTGQTMAFAVLALSQLFHVFNIRSQSRSIFHSGLKGNKAIWGAFLVSTALTLGVMLVPTLSKFFRLATLSVEQILIVLALSVAPILMVEIFKALKLNTFPEENVG
jgi:P-type Ca2+ transporter type 2C